MPQYLPVSLLQNNSEVFTERFFALYLPWPALLSIASLQHYCSPKRGYSVQQTIAVHASVFNAGHRH
eukprot:1145078-Pelagomonas_calceolata.AAC.1